MKKKFHCTPEIQPLSLGKLVKYTLLQKNSNFVSQDVKSLYTDIPNAEGIKLAETSLGNYSK